MDFDCLRESIGGLEEGLLLLFEILEVVYHLLTFLTDVSDDFFFRDKERVKQLADVFCRIVAECMLDVVHTIRRSIISVEASLLSVLATSEVDHNFVACAEVAFGVDAMNIEISWIYSWEVILHILTDLEESAYNVFVTLLCNTFNHQ